jgi:hypothetical protein
MERPVPSLFLLVPGHWLGLEELTRALEANAVRARSDDGTPLEMGEVRIRLVADEHFERAFAWGRNGALDAGLLSRIAMCKRAALVEIGCRLLESAGEVARIGRALRDAGGLAVRMEASGNAAPWETWLEGLEAGVPARIYESSVILARGENRTVFTCGMQLFDLPDAEIALDDTRGAVAWLDAFCIYQLEEQPVFASGHTFRPTADAERRVLERWPDDRHDPNDGRHNPFGSWHLLTPDAARVEATQLTLTFIPTLVSVLIAAERSKGRPLTQTEVEQIVSNGAVVAMEPRDAVLLERSRGYADIEPALAWEQWQIVRRSR